MIHIAVFIFPNNYYPKSKLSFLFHLKVNYIRSIGLNILSISRN